MGKFSYQEVKTIIEKNKYYFLIDKKYNTTKDYLNIIDKYGYKYSTTFTNFKTQIKRNCKLYEFAKYNPYSLYNVLLYIKNNNILITYISGEYISTEKKNLKFLCNNCKNCDSSKDEKRISEYLLNNNIKFETPYKGFKNCKNIRILSFDFYISKLNILIEYDGILHYKDKFNKPIEFKKTKKNDKIKTKYCKDNDIKLIRIPYWNFDNIENILKTTLL